MAFWNLSHVFREPKKDWVTTRDRGKARSNAARSPSPVPDARKAGSPVVKPWEKPLENHGKTIIKKIEKKHGYDSFTQSSLFFYTWIWPSRGGIAKHDHQFSVAAFLTALSVFFGQLVFGPEEYERHYKTYATQEKALTAPWTAGPVDPQPWWVTKAWAERASAEVGRPVSMLRGKS